MDVPFQITNSNPRNKQVQYSKVYMIYVEIVEMFTVRWSKK